MTKRNRIQKVLVWLFISILPLSWAKDSLLLAPTFLNVIEDEIHGISLNFEHGELHLTLHHEKNSKSDAEGKHRHGYNLPSYTHPFNDTLHQHSLNHKLHISAEELIVAASRKNTDNSKSFAPLAISWNPQLPMAPSSAAFLSKPHTGLDSTHPSIHTTVLLI
ncbi:MAG: hypothetical protein AAB197_06605 [Deltaproteobacteria bacterium]